MGSVCQLCLHVSDGVFASNAIVKLSSQMLSRGWSLSMCIFTFPLRSALAALVCFSGQCRREGMRDVWFPFVFYAAVRKTWFCELQRTRVWYVFLVFNEHNQLVYSAWQNFTGTSHYPTGLHKWVETPFKRISSRFSDISSSAVLF